MSDSIDNKDVPNPTSEKPNEEYVPKKAYEETKADMLKFKSKYKEMEAKANQLLADSEARDKQVLKDNEQWKSLYEQTQSKLENLVSESAKRDAQIKNIHKKNAILAEVGGFKKDEYANFINLDAVEMDESGSINPESLASEVNRIKQAYPELLKGAPAPNLPNHAAKGFSGEKSWKNMSQAERDKEKMRLILEQQKQRK